MKLKKTNYYNQKFLGKQLYEIIEDYDEIFIIQEFLDINHTKEKNKEHHIKNEYNDYKLKAQDHYYELDCQDYGGHLYLVFDKPVYVMGKYCANIIAPEIFIKNSENISIFRCVSDKAIIDNNCKKCYEIDKSKINSVYFYNLGVQFWYSEINNFFILNNELFFDVVSAFLNCHKIKCLGKSDNLKNNISNSKKFQNAIIHIE